MTHNEQAMDKRLRISTVGRDDQNSDEYRYPYEPTPYCVLKRLADSGLIRKQDTLLDYGCGKGRVGFFLSYHTKAKVIGIEYDPRIYEAAMENRQTAHPRAKAEFVQISAEEYPLPTEVNRCYFFNPFSVEILHKVMGRILASYYESPRQIFLFFYYPSDDYMAYLMSVDELEFYDEIDCDDLFPGADRRERIMIFELPDYEISS